jgi:hypothetical protein
VRKFYAELKSLAYTFLIPRKGTRHRYAAKRTFEQEHLQERCTYKSLLKRRGYDRGRITKYLWQDISYAHTHARISASREYECSMFALLKFSKDRGCKVKSRLHLRILMAFWIPFVSSCPV